MIDPQEVVNNLVTFLNAKNYDADAFIISNPSMTYVQLNHRAQDLSEYQDTINYIEQMQYQSMVCYSLEDLQ